MIDMNKNFAAGLVAGIGVGVCFGFFLRKNISRAILKKASLQGVSEEASFEELSGECKLILIVRNDLKMGKGKAAAQCSHASVMAYNLAAKKDPSLLKLWLLSGQQKVVVKIESETALKQLRSKANELGLLTSVVRDAGHTQVAPNTLTVMAVGPGPEELVDKATGHLKLY
ncbi:Peptidyl-tRNA hydrolase 2, mitochondrial [Halotydeus destructor]|nr:Peptidyl-tRNA hydrolase 2, mitochondrial [Halotydeus destructor]